MNRALVPFATDAGRSRGRLIAEAEDQTRSVFQRDRDRIIHSTAFRRLKHKTQVFVYHEGDHYRTRLTHTIEVAQIARSLARSLGVDEDLTEALALAHDLGHTPFGHAGESALNQCMADFGGFDHNAQALRIVTRLECHYASFDGLNLSWETLEGLIKHNGPLLDRDRPLSAATVPAAIAEIAHGFEIDLASYASAEAQIAAIADDIAYNAHDIDDGLRAGLFDIIDLGDVPLAGTALSEVLKTWPKLERSRLVHETVRRVISAMVRDVIAETGQRIGKFKPDSAQAVRELEQPLVGLSAQFGEDNRVLQRFLSRRMYHHAKVRDIMARAQRVVRDLFEAYMLDPGKMPTPWQRDETIEEDGGIARHVCDFIAGMTDRYAIEQHQRLFDLGRLFS